MAWQDWFGTHYYRAVLVTTMLEGLGLPIPAELLFLPGVHLANRGEISLILMVLMATLGNTLGGLVGYGVAYWGGPAFMRTAFRWMGVKPQAQQKMELFFAKYGQATVFVSRFVGLIRAATIYSAGVARMSPIRFTVYLVASGLVWNAGWAILIARFQHRALRYLRGHGAEPILYGLLLLLLIVLLGRYLVRHYGKRNPSDP